MKQKLKKQDELLVSFVTGMADEKERETALEWIRASNENLEYFNQLRDIYEASKITQTHHSYNPELSWLKVKSRHYKKYAEKLAAEKSEDYRYFIQKIVKYAAMILVILALTILGFRYMGVKSTIKSQTVWHTIETPFGSRSRVVLADGSKIWLNAGSEIRYASSFGTNNREVFLEGEAYFDVAYDKTDQFIVKTRDLDIKVFGTKFNVKAYPEEDIIQTTLVEGSVIIEGELVKASGSERIELKPKQTATFRTKPAAEVKQEKQTEDSEIIETIDNKDIQIDASVDPEVYTSWKDSEWIIDSEKLSSLAVKLERRYNVKINISSKSLQDYKFTGTLKDETLEQVLDVIMTSAPIKYEIRNNTVCLTANNAFKNTYDKMLIKSN